MTEPDPLDPTRTAVLDPTRTALLVMDVQPAVLESWGGDADGLLDRLQAAIDGARRHGARVGYVRVGFEAQDITAMPPHSGMARAARGAGDRLHAAAPSAQVHERLAPQPGDVVVRKTRVGAFSTTDLDEQLQAAGVTTLVLAGLATSGVVLSTVRDAHDRDYRVLVLSDATADRREHVHAFLTAHVFPSQADVITVAQLDGLFASS